MAKTDDSWTPDRDDWEHLGDIVDEAGTTQHVYWHIDEGKENVAVVVAATDDPKEMRKLCARAIKHETSGSNLMSSLFKRKIRNPQLDPLILEAAISEFQRHHGDRDMGSNVFDEIVEDLIYSSAGEWKSIGSHSGVSVFGEFNQRFFAKRSDGRPGWDLIWLSNDGNGVEHIGDPPTGKTLWQHVACTYDMQEEEEEEEQDEEERAG